MSVKSMMHGALLIGFFAADAQDVFLSTPTSALRKKPNIVWFITDDVDQVLGGSFPLSMGATPMPKTKALMMDAGTYADNWYIHTPICGPSRSQLLTGRYFHNIKNTNGGQGCWKGDVLHVNHSFVNNNTFAKLLKEQAGYTVGMFGKYLNEMPKQVPPGFDVWLSNGGGNYIAPRFMTHNVDGFPDGHWQGDTAPENYTTAVVGNASIAWIKKVAQTGQPFLAYISPKAAHEPFNPAPWYADAWDASWPEHEPREANYNCSFESRKDHHGSVAMNPMITDEAAAIITGVWKNRWRTLMSVDDVISETIKTVEELGLMDSTYFFYTSDHGFELGQFNMLMDKRQPYEWDTKIALLARGPGIKPGSSFGNAGTQVDIAPTLLGLAGLEAPEWMDGKSIVPFLVDSSDATLLETTSQHLKAIGNLQTYSHQWRQEVFIEYYFCDWNIKCVNSANLTCPIGDYPNSDSNCVDLTPGANNHCWCGSKQYPIDPQGTCYATEDASNNWISIRDLSAGRNTVYVEFQRGDQANESIEFDKVDFVEYFDLDEDHEQLINLANIAPSDELQALSERLHKWYACSGKSCP